jgi:hypothetical protein
MGAAHNTLLRTARQEFERLGRIRADTATNLMREGFVVQALEEQWARLGAWVL